MANNGFFRVAFRGFHKQDVLQYIDGMQTTSAQRLSEVDHWRAQAEETAAAESARAAKAVERADELEQANRALQEQVEKLTSLAQMYKRDVVQLREEAQKAADSSDLDAANAKVARLEECVALLSDQNAQYAAIVGDINRLLVEARVISNSHLDAAQQSSNACLAQLDAFLDNLKTQTREAVEASEQRRRDGESRVQSLLAELQDIGVNIRKPAE